MIGTVASQPAPVPEPMRAAILAWYDARGRALAFRATRDPYAILVSEAMAQQTQAARAAEAWSAFLRELPTFEALAVATPAAVLRAWRGLGYNRRALALRRTAIEVVERLGGELPRDTAALERLPGIGPYTARAVAALAFGVPVGAIDTNVRRVLLRSRVGAEASMGSRALQALADASVPVARPGDWTHALMDLGATVCRPRNPHCRECPARPWCQVGATQEPQVPAAGATATPASRRPPGDPVGAPLPETRPGRRASERPAPYPATPRWLRGRIVDRLRDAPDGEWVDLSNPIGSHDVPDVVVALAALAHEGLAERHPEIPTLARLPLA